MAKNFDLAWAREHAGLTQSAAADKMGVSRVTFNRWEQGVVAMPDRRWKHFLGLVGVATCDIPPPSVKFPLPARPRPSWCPEKLHGSFSEDWHEAEMSEYVEGFVCSFPDGVEETEVYRSVQEHDAALALERCILDGDLEYDSKTKSVKLTGQGRATYPPRGVADLI